MITTLIFYLKIKFCNKFYNINFISKRGYIIQFLELYAKINAAFWLIFGLLLVHTALFDKSMFFLFSSIQRLRFTFCTKKTILFYEYIVLTTIFICYYINNQPIIWTLPLTLSPSSFHPFRPTSSFCFLLFDKYWFFTIGNRKVWYYKLVLLFLFM